MRGRKPNTEAELKAKGTWEKGKHADRAALQVIEGEIPAPVDFDEEKAALWRGFCEDLKPFDLPARPHLNALRLLCELVADRRKIDRELQANGFTFKSADGKIKANPGFSIRKQIDDQIMRLYDAFAFNPRASLSMKVAPKAKAKEKQASILDSIKGGKFKTG